MQNSKLCWAFSYFSFYNYWIYLNFCFYFLDWYSYSNYKFCYQIKHFVKAAGTEKYKSIFKKKKKKHDEIVLLVKSKLNSIEILISKDLINSVINHDEFILINNVIKEYNKMKEEIKKLKI